LFSSSETLERVEFAAQPVFEIHVACAQAVNKDKASTLYIGAVLDQKIKEPVVGQNNAVHSQPVERFIDETGRFHGGDEAAAQGVRQGGARSAVGLLHQVDDQPFAPVGSYPAMNFGQMGAFDAKLCQVLA